MGAKNALPVEITVQSKPGDETADVRWKFTRKQITHRFSMTVYTQPTGLDFPVKNHEFRVEVPTAKGSGPPYSITYTHKISAPEYRTMVTSVLLIIKKHDLVLQAQTDPKGWTSVRDKEFKYPLWRDRPDGYDPLKLREALLATSSLMRPKRAVVGVNWPVSAPNGKPPEPVLPVPGKIEKIDPISVIEDHMPPHFGDQLVYSTAIANYKAEIHAVRQRILDVMDGLEPDRRKVYEGYVKLLYDILQCGDALIARNNKPMAVDVTSLPDKHAN